VGARLVQHQAAHLFYFSVMFCTIQNNKAIVLESFIQIFGMTTTYFSEILSFPKSN
jgi:hypothetical protein